MNGHEYRVVESAVLYSGSKFDFVKDSVVMPGGSVADRVYVKHPGAVAVVALDDRQHVLLTHQYRPAVGRFFWEIPAGLRDVEGEDLLDTARRELSEETDYEAGKLEPLLEVYASPGCSSERVSIFLGTNVTPSATQSNRVDEEAELTTRWWPLEDAVAAIFSGEITNNICVSGLLATQQYLAR